MKRVMAAALSLIVLLTCAFSTNAANYDYNDSELFTKYSPYEVISMYPEVSEYIASELRKFNTDISLADYEISVNDIGAIFYSVVCENPDIFYVRLSNFESTSERDTGLLMSIRPNYIFDLKDIPDKQKAFEKAADYVISGVDKSWSDEIKCRYIHDMINQYVHYDMDIYNTDPNLRTAYGALIDNNAVCDGYTLAYNYLLKKLGIEAHYVQSLQMTHAWSMVKLGGKYYHVDTTYDDPSYDNLGKSLHTYCLVSDNKLKSDRVHYDWICGMKAGDTSFDNAWWRDICTFIYPVSGYEYYMNQSYGSSIYGAFMQRNMNNGSVRAVEKISTRWTLENNPDAFWEKAYCYLTFDGNYFYYNDTEGVYRHKPDNSSYFDVLYKKPASMEHNIYGVALDMEAKLHVTIKSSPNVADVIYYIDKNTMNQNTDAEEKPVVTDYHDVSGGVMIDSFADNSENIIIPSVINGQKVVALGENVFSDRRNLKSVIIPEGVVSIGYSTFYNCPNLESVTLPDSLQTIGTAAFTGCTALDELTIPKNVNKIEKNAFMGCVNLTIKGYKNTTAQAYAELYKIDFVALDDVVKPEPSTQPTTAPIKKSKPVISQKCAMYVMQSAKIKDIGGIIKCSTSNKSVATVSSGGVITAKKKGSAVVKIEDKNYIYKVILTVKNPKLNKFKLSIKPYKSFKLKVKGAAGTISFKSSNKKVATVTYKGLIKARRKGKATITVKTNGKIKLKCKVTVK